MRRIFFWKLEKLLEKDKNEDEEQQSEGEEQKESKGQTSNAEQQEGEEQEPSNNGEQQQEGEGQASSSNGGEGQQEGEEGEDQASLSNGGEEQQEGEEGEDQASSSNGGEPQQEGEDQASSSNGGEGQQEGEEVEDQASSSNGGEEQQEGEEGEDQASSSNGGEPQQEGEDQASSSNDGEPQQEGEGQQTEIEELYNPFKGMKRYGEDQENIEKSPGFSLDYEGEDVEVPDSIINMLVDRFLNMHFTDNNTDLNRRNNNLMRDNGDLKWNIPDLIRHKVTKDLVKMPYDKYGYRKDDGKGEDIPLSFYIDLSGSMSDYSHLLSLIGIKLMQRKIKILVGYNELVYYQINSVPSSFSLELFKELIENEMKYEELQSDSRYRGVSITEVQQNIDDYLIEKNAKKVVVFTDFDAKSEIESLSRKSEVWWFCFEERRRYRGTDIHEFKGHFYNTQELKDFSQHLKNISSRMYEQRQRRMREASDYGRD